MKARGTGTWAALAVLTGVVLLTGVVPMTVAAATAGVISTTPVTYQCYGSGGCPGAGDGSVAHTFNVTYRAEGDPSTRITVEKGGDGGLLLSDSISRVRLEGTAETGCSLLGAHRAICPIYDRVTVYAGDRGDVIDARHLNGEADATLDGGAGNDVIYAPSEGGTVVGGAGHNVLRGNKSTTVSYQQAPGPVSVDLARGIAVTRGERDRLVGISTVLGSKRFSNRILGPRRPWDRVSYITGGPAGNFLLARGFSDIRIAEGAHRPSTVVCENARSYVSEVESNDLIAGTCNVGQVDLLGPIPNVAAPLLLAFRPELWELPLSRVTVVALSSGDLLCELVVAAPGAGMPCRLNAGGRAMLKRVGRMLVRVTEFDTDAAHEKPLVRHTFRYLLALQKR